LAVLGGAGKEQGNVSFAVIKLLCLIGQELMGRYEKTSGGGSDHHIHFSQSNLFDQCIVENSFFAAGWRKWGGGTIHGLTAMHSVYWNLTINLNGIINPWSNSLSYSVDIYIHVRPPGLFFSLKSILVCNNLRPDISDVYY